MAETPTGGLPPGSVIGVMGGGQLGRMTALAAARLGYRCHIFSPEPDSPASQVTSATTVAPYDDPAAVESFADAVDVVTFEFENIPVETIRAVEARAPVRPGAKALSVAQDRVHEKEFLTSNNIATAPFAEVTGERELAEASKKIGVPAILKTARLGYDGKGQARIEDLGKLKQAWQTVGEARAILEGFVDFEREISVIMARGLDGACAGYVPVENRHVGGILDTTIAPAPIGDATAGKAQQITRRIAEALDLVGLLAVEMFVTSAGEILVNEIAPRPHNSGHWTMDACATSQFEQLVRAVCGLPLGSPERHSDAVMKNLIGDEADRWPEFLAEPGARLHLYGKAETRPGRKMGHVTRLYPLGTPDLPP